LHVEAFLAGEKGYPVRMPLALDWQTILQMAVIFQEIEEWQPSFASSLTFGEGR
jgi:hypothetical protein